MKSLQYLQSERQGAYECGYDLAIIHLLVDTSASITEKGANKFS